MLETKHIQTWMAGYIKAWNSNDPGDIGSIFSEDARYYTAPYREPWSGRQKIIEGWLDRKDEPDEYEFDYEILGLSDNKAFVRGWTHYIKEEKRYSNLWIVSLNKDGQCTEFIEWWMRNR